MSFFINVVILVNDRDEWAGTANKFAGHCSRVLHRAVSIFITNSSGKILLHQTVQGKQRSAGLWRNARSARPAANGPVVMAAIRGMKHDLCIDSLLKPVLKVHYRAGLDNGHIEHEPVTCQRNREVLPAPSEAQDYAWVNTEDLEAWKRKAPGISRLLFRSYSRHGGSMHGSVPLCNDAA